jgi:hypothetical protein
MSPTVVWRLARACALGGLSLGFVSCYENEGAGSPTITALFDSVRRVSMKACECEAGDPDIPAGINDCSERLERLDCVEPIVQKHSEELGDWADCALAVYTELEDCFERFGCAAEADDSCFDDAEVDDLCGDLPEQIDETIEDETSKACLEDIQCADGTVVPGNECNEIAECADGSDEQLC